jgi:acetoin utilization deacetylase AcuC-like enzyme
LAAAIADLKAATPGFECVELSPRDASADELRLIHTPEHVERIASTQGRRGLFDADTFYAPDTFAAAQRAAGAALGAVDVLRDRADHAIALVRPPGHHATADRAMGFCLFNNAALAAAYAIERGKQRVLVVDWDVHHGNGTQDIFYDRSDVLYLSLHESPQYPGTGAVEETGAGRGRGYTVNIPLSAGATDAVYEIAFERIVVPIIEQYAPELVVVSAGYDAHLRDPLGRMALSDSAYFSMTRRIVGALPDAGVGRLLFLLEGGYDEAGIEGAVHQTLAALSPDAEARSVTEDIEPPWADQLDVAARSAGLRWSL